MTLLFDDLPQRTKRASIPDNVNTRAWRAAVDVLTSQGGMTEKRARVLIGSLMKRGLRPEDLQSAADGAKKAGTLDPTSYLQRAASEALLRRKSIVEIDAPSEERQRAWMREYKENPASWRADVRGPMPGQPGCRVSGTILREFGA